MIKANEAEVVSRGELIGFGICPKCRVINKVRTGDEYAGDKFKCRTCGTEITITTKMAR